MELSWISGIRVVGFGGIIAGGPSLSHYHPFFAPQAKILKFLEDP